MKKRESMKIVPPGKKKCVWMEAGVVSYKLCDNNYDCTTCAYDHAMDAKVARQKEAEMTEPLAASADKMSASWIEMMMKLPASQRKCRYMLTEEIDRKLCPNAYDCGTCSFDQMMQERLQAEPLPVHASGASAGFDIAEGFYYHDGHAWARPEYGGRVRVGIDDFARKLLGSRSRVTLPEVGQAVKQGESGFMVKRNGESAQVLSPIDGTVTHINHRLLDNPELINESPYEEGWLFTVEPTKLRKNLKGLYFGDDAHTFISEEQEKLFAMANEDMQISADGGESVEDIFEELEEKDWARIVAAFLKT